MGAVEGSRAKSWSVDSKEHFVFLWKFQKIFLNNNHSILVIKFGNTTSENHRQIGCPCKANISSKTLMTDVKYMK